MTGTRHPGGIATVAAFRPRRSSRLSHRPGHHHRKIRCPAEREGFEPSVRVNAHTLSKRAPSATQTPLHIFGVALLLSQREEDSTLGRGNSTLDFESSAFNHSTPLLIRLSALFLRRTRKSLVAHPHIHAAEA